MKKKLLSFKEWLLSSNSSLLLMMILTPFIFEFICYAIILCLIAYKFKGAILNSYLGL